ncbi:hypothetical protein MTR67_017771 [Solanum verrucosum]|uniref:Uncharacterized protein n=1 Tax=Solanum verrucosum TaxID=315347 RepID=A0AAF0QPL7_SOLVR|nr:hypothetical protein MTR67_017771 [Solanum verrucosum]
MISMTNRTEVPRISIQRAVDPVDHSRVNGEPPSIPEDSIIYVLQFCFIRMLRVKKARPRVRLGPAMVFECRSRPGLSMSSTAHIGEGKKELAKDVHRFARLGVILIDFTEGGIEVMSRAESSLMSEMKEKQDQDPILLELKANVHKQ